MCVWCLRLPSIQPCSSTFRAEQCCCRCTPRRRTVRFRPRNRPRTRARRLVRIATTHRTGIGCAAIGCTADPRSRTRARRLVRIATTHRTGIGCTANPRPVSPCTQSTCRTSVSAFVGLESVGSTWRSNPNTRAHLEIAKIVDVPRIRALYVCVHVDLERSSVVTGTEVLVCKHRSVCRRARCPDAVRQRDLVVVRVSYSPHVMRRVDAVVHPPRVMNGWHVCAVSSSLSSCTRLIPLNVDVCTFGDCRRAGIQIARRQTARSCLRGRCSSKGGGYTHTTEECIKKGRGYCGWTCVAVPLRGDSASKSFGCTSRTVSRIMKNCSLLSFATQCLPHAA